MDLHERLGANGLCAVCWRAEHGFGFVDEMAATAERNFRMMQGRATPPEGDDSASEGNE